MWGKTQYSDWESTPFPSKGIFIRKFFDGLKTDSECQGSVSMLIWYESEPCWMEEN